MTNNIPFIEPMSTASMSSGSDLTVDLLLHGIDMKMGLTSQNAGIAAIGLICFAVGALVGALVVNKLELKCDDVLAFTEHVTPEELRARLEALERGNAEPVCGDMYEQHEQHEQQLTEPEICK